MSCSVEDLQIDITSSRKGSGQKNIFLGPVSQQFNIFGRNNSFCYLLGHFLPIFKPWKACSLWTYLPNPPPFSKRLLNDPFVNMCVCLVWQIVVLSSQFSGCHNTTLGAGFLPLQICPHPTLHFYTYFVIATVPLSFTNTQLIIGNKPTFYFCVNFCVNCLSL